ncbi:YkvA family protein [Planctomyces sp. SH-PL14]|uniref:YkvA family protein n=1 Tax=Planctomyces sp. SH-PL14 TaxID=1632864 RepID=UPI00078E467D|nr:DUF1232 domain-containing protein [Planctomyces sp. SH-PL14]AMV22639.1 hypothetical protein VT03_32385 [Planctomyces sp. SH-PL14]
MKLIKATFVGFLVLVYCISPLDFIPDIIPLLGWGDDLAALVAGGCKIAEILNGPATV